MRVKLATKEIMLVFEYLDKNRDGYIDYHEFCNLTEEKRRGIDPFEQSSAKKTLEHFINERSIKN